ncbi:MAG: helix-turn-helix transcriptional regulator [Aureispira sp.]
MYTLPNYFLSSDSTSDVVQHFYKSNEAIDRSQIQLTHHLISFLQEGEKIILLPEQTVHIHSDSFLLLSKGQCLMTEKLSTEQRYRSHLLFFKHNIVQDFLLKHQIEIPDQTAPSNIQVLQYNPFVHNFVASLKFAPPADAIFLRHKVEEFLLYSYRQYGASFFSFLKTPPVYDWQQVTLVAQKAIYEKLTLEQMAFLCSMSVSTFKRRFAKYYKSTPQSWLREQRLQRAALLLRQGEYRPSELSEELGFQHHSSFTAAFKSRFGVTPSAYVSQA